jgi:hypothetical protein
MNAPIRVVGSYLSPFFCDDRVTRLSPLRRVPVLTAIGAPRREEFV